MRSVTMDMFMFSNHFPPLHPHLLLFALSCSLHNVNNVSMFDPDKATEEQEQQDNIIHTCTCKCIYHLQVQYIFKPSKMAARLSVCVCVCV